MAVVNAYLRTKWHFDPFIRLAAREIGTKLEAVPLLGELGARGTPTIPPSYIRGRAVVQECGEGQTDRQTAYASREM